MSGCNHKEVNINPTIETVWGLSDNCNVECVECKKIIMEDSSPKNIKAKIVERGAVIVSGQKYL